MNNCKVCLTEIENLIKIFSTEGKKQKIAEIIGKHFGFLKDSLKKVDSSAVCLSCWNQIKSFEEYYSLIYQKHVENGGKTDEKDIYMATRSRSILKTSFKKSEPELEFEIPEIKCEIFNETELTSTDQDHEIGEIDNTKNVLDEIFKCDSDVSVKQESNEQDNEMKEKPKKKRKPARTKLKQTSVTSEKSKSEEELKKIQENEEHERLIREYCKMACDLCEYSFKNYRDVKVHFRSQHGMKGYLVCCNKKFAKKFYIVDHIMAHKNPDTFRCEICQKNYKDRIALKIHMSLHGSLEFKCTHPGCEKGFSKQHKLNAHMKSSHIPEEELIYSCDFCARRFSSAARMQYHHKQMHSNDTSFMCDICGKSLKTKSNLEFHRRTHNETEETIQRIQCSICSHWLKDKYSFRKHSKRHEQEKEDNSCNICGKRSSNRDALKAHIKYVHLTERTHQCSMCEKAFKTALTLKEHMASHGSGQTLYECNVCSKTFNSNANMHSHRKKMHPVEWSQTLMPKYLKP